MVSARQVGATVRVVDVGAASDVGGIEGVLVHRVRAGTADLAHGPAMTTADACDALDVGVAVADELLAQGHDLLVTGDMGIGNTTPSAALIAALTGADARTVTGRGTDIDDAMLDTKIDVVERAVARARRGSGDAISLLAELGGLAIGALAGFC